MVIMGNIYSLYNFHICNTVLLIIITVPHRRSPDLTSLLGQSCTLLSISPFSLPSILFFITLLFIVDLVFWLIYIVITASVRKHFRKLLMKTTILKWDLKRQFRREKGFLDFYSKYNNVMHSYHDYRFLFIQVLKPLSKWRFEHMTALTHGVFHHFGGDAHLSKAILALAPIA